MAVTERDIDSFARFAKGQLSRGGHLLSIDELFDQWRVQQPPPADVLAIKASLRDMEDGERGRPFSEFCEEFRQRNGIPERD
jgi:hypothetical protein